MRAGCPPAALLLLQLQLWILSAPTHTLITNTRTTQQRPPAGRARPCCHFFFL